VLVSWPAQPLSPAEPYLSSHPSLMHLLSLLGFFFSFSSFSETILSLICLSQMFFFPLFFPWFYLSLFVPASFACCYLYLPYLSTSVVSAPTSTHLDFYFFCPTAYMSPPDTHSSTFLYFFILLRFHECATVIVLVTVRACPTSRTFKLHFPHCHIYLLFCLTIIRIYSHLDPPASHYIHPMHFRSFILLSLFLGQASVYTGLPVCYVFLQSILSSCIWFRSTTLARTICKTFHQRVSFRSHHDITVSSLHLLSFCLFPTASY